MMVDPSVAQEENLDNMFEHVGMEQQEDYGAMDTTTVKEVEEEKGDELPESRKGEIEKLRARNKLLEEKNRRFEQRLASSAKKEKNVTRRRASGTDPVSVVTQELKAKNLDLFTRLAAQKSATKAARDEIVKRDTQICVLTEHIDKLMGVLKQEGLARKDAETKKAEAEDAVFAQRGHVKQLAMNTRSANKRATAIGKHDKMLEKQLSVMDHKFQQLYTAYQQHKGVAKKKEKAMAMKIESISSAHWEAESKAAEVSTARANTLLGACKMFESVFGQMSCCMIDFQECMLGDAGAKAIGRAIQAAVGRQNQRSDVAQESHAKRFDAWNCNENAGPIPKGSTSSGGVLSKGRSCVLNLAFNGITDAGTKSLCVALAKSKFITEVDLRGNLITKKSIPFLADMLMYNAQIEAVDLSGNYFTKDVLAEYIVALEERAKRADANEERGSKRPSSGRSKHSSRSSSSRGSENDSSSSDDDSSKSSDSEDEDEALLSTLPVLSSRDKGCNSIFRFTPVQRPSSAPPRCYTTQRERHVGSFVPKHAYHSSNPSSSKFKAMRRADILEHISKTRLFPPQKTPQSALSRITLDSISSKIAQSPLRKIQPRPESALVAREGGQEDPAVAKAMISGKAVKRQARPRTASGSPTNSALAGIKTTASGKVKFMPCKLRNRLQVSTSSAKRSSTAPGKSRARGKGSPSCSITMLDTSMGTNATKKGPKSSSAFSPVKKGGKSTLKKTTKALEVASKTFAEQEIKFAPSSMQCAFTFARKGNLGGILNLMKTIEPSPLLNKCETISFAANMRQLQTGETVIMHAARTGKRDVIELMLERGGDINARSLEGWTALHHAADTGRSDMIDLLLQYGADVNAGAGIMDGSALHLAIRLGKRDIMCKLLSAKNVDLDVRDSKGRAPLHLAALSGRTHLARLLCANGASKDAKDNKNKTPLAYAEQRNDLGMQEALLC